MKQSLENKPLVSVIVPVYNQSEHLHESLDSILAQTYENLEIILINDGSTDDSEKICQEYCKKDNRFKLHNKTNGGLSDARNVGIKIAKGNFICFVDGDDIISARYITHLLGPLLENTESKVSACRYVRFTNQLPVETAVEPKSQSISSRQFYLNTLYQKNQTLFSVSVANKLFSKSIFKNIKFDKGVLYEDLAIIDRILLQSPEIELVDEILYYYRTTENSITTSEFTPRKLDMIKHCDDLLDRYQDDTEITAALTVMKFTRTFECLYYMRESKLGDRQTESSLWQYIKNTRSEILKNPNARKAVKLAATSSYLGLDIALAAFALNRKRRSKNEK